MKRFFRFGLKTALGLTLLAALASYWYGSFVHGHSLEEKTFADAKWNVQVPAAPTFMSPS